MQGQERGEDHYDKMGMYELMEERSEGSKAPILVNGRKVWQVLGGRDLFIWHFSQVECGGTSPRWCLSDRANMEANSGGGFMGVVSAGGAPDKATETWRMYDKPVTRWIDVPKVKAFTVTVEEVRAAKRQIELERQQAIALSREVRAIVVEGQVQGDCHADKMGIYKLMEGKEVNQRGVWQMSGGHELFVYYASKTSGVPKWWISNRKGMEAGMDVGCIQVSSNALTPDKATETWNVAYNGMWPAAPKMKIRAHITPSSMQEAPGQDWSKAL
jgi:hypothetical protein